MFFVFEIFAFLAENDVTNFVPKFGFANIGYLTVLFERTAWVRDFFRQIWQQWP